jgi:hypothetical protein
MRWQLHGVNATASAVFSIQYTQRESIVVTNELAPRDAQRISPLAITRGENALSLLDQPSAGCGAHIYDVESRTLTFKLTGHPNCRLVLSLSNSLYVSVRYSMTVSEFWNVNGTTLLIDNIASALGIPTEQIRIVSLNTTTTSSSAMARLLQEEQEVLEVQLFVDSLYKEASFQSEVVQKQTGEWTHKLQKYTDEGKLSLGTHAPVEGVFNVVTPSETTPQTEQPQQKPHEPTPRDPVEQPQAGNSSGLGWYLAVAIPVVLVFVGIFVFGIRKSKEAKQINSSNSGFEMSDKVSMRA